MKKILIASVLFFAACLGFSQSADKITEILQTQRITYAQAAYLAQSAVDEAATDESAFAALQNSGAIKEGVAPTEEITMQDFAKICLTTWQIKGSLMLKLFKNGRYAFRQMKTDGVIPKNADPSATLTGRDALNIVTNCIDNYEQNIDLEGWEKVQRGGKK